MFTRLLQVFSGREQTSRSLFLFATNLLFYSTFMYGCCSLPPADERKQSFSEIYAGERRLSNDEMKKYNLTGIIHEAQICENSLNKQKTALVVSGKCEIIRCEFVLNELVCFAKPE